MRKGGEPGDEDIFTLSKEYGVWSMGHGARGTEAQHLSMISPFTDYLRYDSFAISHASSVYCKHEVCNPIT